MMNMTNLDAIGMDTLWIDSGWSMEREFTEFIYMNLIIKLYLTINQVYSCHGYVHGPLT